MANTKISQLTANTNPSGSEEMVYALSGTNGKMSLNTMKTFVQNNLTGYATTADLTTGLAGKQDTLVSGTNIRTINGASVMGSGDIIVTGGTGYTAGPGIDITGGVISATGGGGAGGYDCVVAADGTGDYTTIAAAVNAGKQNIFVRNGNYTENVQRDVYTAGKNTLHITGESYLGVNITVDKDTPTLNSNGRFINMQLPTGFTEFDFYMKNLNFVLDFSGGISYFFRTSGKGKFLVEDCGFTYSGGTGNNYLFHGSNIFEITNDGISYSGTKCNMFDRCVFTCSTDAATGFVYVMSSGSIVAENCVFLTSGTGVMSIVGSSSGHGYIKHCRLEVYGLYFDEQIAIINCKIKILSGGAFYRHDASLPNDFECEFIENSDFSISGDLGIAGTVALGGVCKNCTISISATNLTGFELGRELYLNKRNCFGTRVSYSGTVTLHANTYGLDLTTTSLVITGHGLHYSGINAYGGTVSITADYAVIIGNNWDGATVTDSGTGNVVANNVA